jgi:hypothetical protein
MHTLTGDMKTTRRQRRSSLHLDQNGLRLTLSWKSMKKLLSSIVTKQVRPILANRKTTLAGLIVIAHALHTFVSHLHAVAEGQIDVDLDSLQSAVGEAVVGWGLLMARDANRSSQDSGVR